MGGSARGQVGWDFSPPFWREVSEKIWNLKTDLPKVGPLGPTRFGKPSVKGFTGQGFHKSGFPIQGLFSTGGGGGGYPPNHQGCPLGGGALCM